MVAAIESRRPETAYPRPAEGTSGYRSYNPELGQWLSRDPIQERGGYNLYGFVQNVPVNWTDALGEMSLASLGLKVWTAIKDLGSSVWEFTNDQLKKGPAVGVQGEFGVIAQPVSFIYGVNGMFFPETCQFAKYWYLSGSLEAIADLILGNPSFEEFFFDFMPSIGSQPPYLSAEMVSASPIGADPHGPESWRGWFYNIQASGPVAGVPLSGSVFWSDTWVGLSAGAGLGAPGGGYAKTFYRYAPDEGNPSKKVKGCLCTGLRVLALVKPEALREIVAAWFGITVVTN